MQIFLAETRVEFPPKLVSILNQINVTQLSGYVFEVFKLSLELKSVKF